MAEQHSLVNNLLLTFCFSHTVQISIVNHPPFPHTPVHTSVGHLHGRRAAFRTVETTADVDEVHDFCVAEGWVRHVAHGKDLPQHHAVGPEDKEEYTIL